MAESKKLFRGNPLSPRSKKPFSDIYPLARKILVAAIGGTVFLFGIALIFLPGPSIVVIPVGLGILATEFIWARKLLKRLKDKIHELKGKAGSKR